MILFIGNLRENQYLNQQSAWSIFNTCIKDKSETKEFLFGLSTKMWFFNWWTESSSHSGWRFSVPVRSIKSNIFTTWWSKVFIGTDPFANYSGTWLYIYFLLIDLFAISDIFCCLNQFKNIFHPIFREFTPSQLSIFAVHWQFREGISHRVKQLQAPLSSSSLALPFANRFPIYFSIQEWTPRSIKQSQTNSFHLLCHPAPRKSFTHAWKLLEILFAPIAQLHTDQ